MHSHKISTGLSVWSMCWLALLGCDTSRPIEEEIGGATANLSIQSAKGSARLQDMERLGKVIFADKQLSVSGTLACAGCHEERHAFTGDNRPRGRPLPVAAGAFPQLLGNRNSPTIKYMGFSPEFGFAKDGDAYTPTGGQFWDGRADTLAEQAKGPFLNPREMAMPSKAAVIDQIRAARYAPLFKRVFGLGSLENVDQAYDRVAQAIEAFELTKRFQPFSSKFDAVLRGTARFTQAEARGFELFKSPQKGNCIGCHAGEVTSRQPTDWLFTDFTYDSLGVPRNLEIPDNADPNFYDLGLCEQPGIEGKVPPAAGDPSELVRSLCGAFKVPTLRNVAKTAPYMHNGFFKQLRDVVEFYVTRDTNPGKWYPRDGNGEVQKFNDLPSAYHGNVNTSEVPYDRKIGEAPHLQAAEIDDVVAFLNTLSDDD